MDQRRNNETGLTGTTLGEEFLYSLSLLAIGWVKTHVDQMGPPDQVTHVSLQSCPVLIVIFFQIPDKDIDQPGAKNRSLQAPLETPPSTEGPRLELGRARVSSQLPWVTSCKSVGVSCHLPNEDSTYLPHRGWEEKCYRLVGAQIRDGAL